ncbi:MAG: hypothetical protein ACXWTT_11245 [Methylobacter sp.]
MNSAITLAASHLPVVWIAHRLLAVRASPRAAHVQIRSRRISPAVHAGMTAT